VSFHDHSARYYIPWLGRWLSADPIGIGDGVNVYAYCQGNPIILLDENGQTAAGFYTIEGQAINSSLVKDTSADANKVYIVEKEGDNYKINKEPSNRIKISHTQLPDRAS
jgi:uncharacterized protein RhaS with RHS repeats